MAVTTDWEVSTEPYLTGAVRMDDKCGLCCNVLPLLQGCVVVAISCRLRTRSSASLTSLVIDTGSTESARTLPQPSVRRFVRTPIHACRSCDTHRALIACNCLLLLHHGVVVVMLTVLLHAVFGANARPQTHAALCDTHSSWARATWNARASLAAASRRGPSPATPSRG